MHRRDFIVAALATTVLAKAAHAAGPRILVAKSPTCGCCGAWIDRMRDAGFAVDARDVDQDTLYALKAQLGIGPEHASCHTAQVDGYVIEGHVPAQDIQRLLAERPDAAGLAVPGMPTGSPGMEMGDERDPYDTLLVRKDGSATVFAQH
ncbi:MAG: hypothetical protein ACJAVR_002310 [Paracoccaceae bacterium]|jgi:hypothetical protein